MKQGRLIIVFISVFLAAILTDDIKAQSQMTITQPEVMLTQFWAMPTLYNPAATGEIDYIRIRGGARLQTLGIYHAPKNFVGAADAPFKVLGKKIGAGIIANSESYDLYRNLLVGAQGSYKLPVKRNLFSFGIQIGYYHSKFKGSEMIIRNPGGDSDDGEQVPDQGGGSEDSGIETMADNDYEEEGSNPYDELPTHDVAGGAFDISLGVRFEHPYFHIGIAGLHLTNPTMKLSTEGESSSDARYLESKLPRMLYFDAGGNIPIPNSLISLQPSLLLSTDFTDLYAVVDMRATYNRKITFGLDYRYNRAVGVMAGINIKNFFLGYSWEYDYKKITGHNTGNHEVVIGYQFKLDMGGKNLFSHRSIRLM